ncbi:serine/threonine protein kinase [Pendulispora albinea]|uniref:Protein kinase n=1 Tax=Pendulispora albinea TaxID=2741071 RepID=A0ABZ2M939_9BACT
MSDLATQLLETITASAESATRAREASTPAFLELGDEIEGRYRIEELLGTGGTARVWLARDAVEDRHVALKEIEVMPASVPDEEEESALMFRREFFAMKRLQHPFTVKVYDCGLLPSGNRYITMERVEGVDLRARVRERPLDSAEAFDLLMRMAQILAFIHARLFVHCDIKADNVRLLPDGSIKLMDFGLMHQLGTPTMGRLWGTAAYIAPEWVGGAAIDGRADLYSLGVLGFFAVTGQHPFHAATVQELLRAHRIMPPPLPSSLAPAPLHPELTRVLLRLLAKDPADRFQTANDLVAALGAVSDMIPSEEPLAARASYLHVATVVGRKNEAARLEEALVRAERGEARALLIGAPAGTGKSRLLSELELYAKLSDVAFAFGQCHAEGLAPLAPLRRALRLLLPVTPADLVERIREPLALLLPPEYASPEVRGSARPVFDTDARGAPAEPAPSRRRIVRTPAEEKWIVFEALSLWLTELAKLRPFVLCFEDLHWADDATVEHLNVIIRALQGTRGLVCGTFRVGELTRLSPLYQTVYAGAAEILELLPLSREHLRELVALALPGFEAPEAFVLNLHAATHGNVFFATECLRALVEQGALRRVHGSWFAHGDLAKVALPGSIGEAIGLRLATLSPEHLDFLQRTAPAGRVLDMTLLRAAAEPESDEKLFSSLDEAVERQFLQYSAGQYHFTHDTVHKTIYDATPEANRRRHHGRIAEHLERSAGRTPEGARAIGYHFARSHEPARAIAPLLFASQHLLAHSGMLAGYRILKEAESLLEAHPDYPNRTELQVAAWGKLIEVGYSSDTPASFFFAEKLFSYWSTAVDMDAGRAIVHRRKGEKNLYREIPVRANMSAEEAFLKRAEYRILQSIALAIMGRTAEFQKVLEKADLDGDSDSPFRAAAYIAKGGLTAHTGHFAGIVDELQGHLEVLRAFHAEKIGAPARLSWALAMGSYFLNMNLALMGKEMEPRATDDGMSIAAELGFIELRIYHVFSKLVRASFIGDQSSFAPHYSEMNDWMRRLGSPSLPERNLAIYTPPYYLERGEIDLATAIVQRGIHISENVLPGDAWLKLYVAVYRGCLLVLRREYDLAHTALTHAIREAHARDFRMETYALVYLSRLERLRGDLAAAREAAELALARATAPLHANPFDEILARRAIADLVHGSAGDRELEIAREVAEGSGNVLQHGITLLTLAERRAGTHPGGACALLALAQKYLTAAGALGWLQKAERLRGSWS